MTQNKIDTVIFDIGDVLAKGGHRTIIKALGEEYSKKEHSIWQDYKTGKCTEQQYWQRVLAKTRLEGEEKSIAKIAREIFRNSPKGDAYRFLAPLKDAGYNLAVLSNHSTEWAGIIVEQFGIKKFCDPILISSDIQLEKPDPAIYAYTLKSVNREKEPHKCLFIDDKVENVLAARHAGMRVFHFKDKEGFKADELLENELNAYGLLK